MTELGAIVEVIQSCEELVFGAIINKNAVAFSIVWLRLIQPHNSPLSNSKKKAGVRKK